MKKPIYSFLFLAGFFLLVPLSCKKDDPFNDDYEPNNSRSKATSIELGSPLDAGIGKDDSDWYRIVVDNDGIIDITEISITDVSANLDVACTIYDSNGNPF